MNAERCEFPGGCQRPGARLASHPTAGDLLVCTQHDYEIRRQRTALMLREHGIAVDKMK